MNTRTGQTQKLRIMIYKSGVVFKGTRKSKFSENGMKHMPYACLAPGLEEVSTMQWIRNENFSWQWKSHTCLPLVPPTLWRRGVS